MNLKKATIRKVGFTTYRGGPYRESRVVVQRFRIEQELVLEEWLWVVVLSEALGPHRTSYVVLTSSENCWTMYLL